MKLSIHNLDRERIEECGCTIIDTIKEDIEYIIDVPNEEALNKLDKYWCNPAIWSPIE
jgi:hypothetical protein